MPPRRKLKHLSGVATLAVALFASAPALAEGCRLGILADLPVTMEGTRASVPVRVNGQDTRFWLDSGAFFSIMSRAKAAELGLAAAPLPIGFFIEGIGGDASVELTRVKSLGIVGQDLKDMAFLVGGTDVGNGLIGRNILGMADTEFDLADGSVKLINPHGCGQSTMAYWAGTKPYFTVPLLPEENSVDHVFKLPVTINGIRLEAEFDTGADSSVLSRSAAVRAGIDLAAPGVVPTKVGGLGRHWVRGWVVPVANVTIGNEQILRTHIEVYDDTGATDEVGTDMLLGADYMMAHHIYVARSQRQIWFTYTGGKPFHTALEPSVAAKPGPASSAAPPPGTHMVEAVANSAGDPQTADGLARRGAARITADDTSGAIADLSAAIRQSPGTASYYADRARAYAQAGDGAAERSDIDKALALDPNNGELLRRRSALRLGRSDRAGALADAEAAVRLTPPASLESGELAQLFIDLRQPERAIALFNAVIAAHQDDAGLGDMLNGRCRARALANVDLDKALADCNRAIRQEGARADWLDSRGLVYFRRADYALAIGDYDAALKLTPGMAWSLYLRGQARLALGQTAAGQADQLAASAVQSNIADVAAGYGIAGVKTR